MRLTTRVPLVSSLVLVAAVVAGSVAAIPAAHAETVAPTVVPNSANPPVGSIMPNFQRESVSKKPMLRSGEQSYSVTIDSVPTQVAPGKTFTVTGHTTGFAPGNWINAWVRLPDGQQFDDGGIVTSGGSFTIPMTLTYPGAQKIQISAGKWPTEQWSQPVTVNVDASSYSSGVGVLYHDLNGNPVAVMSGSGDTSDPRSPVYFSLNYGNFSTVASASQVGPDVVAAVTPVSGDLAQLPPNSTGFEVHTFYGC